MHSSGEGIGERAVGPLRTAVTDLLDLPLTPMSDDEVVDAMRDVERCVRRLAALQHRLLVEANERSLPARCGAKSLKRFLMETLRLASADAGARVHQALWVATFHDMAGEPMDPQLPHTAKALRSGEISADHARGVAAVMNRVPRGTSTEDREAAEQILAEFARSGSPDDIGKIGERILAHLDPDGRLTTDNDRARMRGLTVGRQRPDGMSPIRGEIDPVLRALLDPLLAKYARPGVCNPEDPESPAVDVDRVNPRVLAEAAGRDHRSTAQRNHDAVQALLASGVIAEELGSHRGVPVATVLTMKVGDLEQMSGVATTATGGTIPIGDALAMAQRSRPFLAVFDHAGLPLHLGRMKRLASRSQRLALIAVLRGCSRPGCGAPASMCAVHHVLDYRKGGSTDIDNLTLACDACHALIHDGPGGWRTVAEVEDSSYAGRTAWIAPPHIDPERIPEVNHRHHANELFAEVVTRIHLRNEREREEHQRWLREQSQRKPFAA
ncbi:HNH endonuclease signature motif containing protein [Nocardia mexicana]|uniref:HNH endonuclease n=1 Tax=Nocardia mexicana TaxID=279262 RepID=A0A370HBF1_9NOCA|nr:HNH endonuclease signature motif containing protein [Nocardia mexicana]RDI54248.1 HNH endonuclease [Nocardia mexicana]